MNHYTPAKSEVKTCVLTNKYPFRDEWSFEIPDKDSDSTLRAVVFIHTATVMTKIFTIKKN